MRPTRAVIYHSRLRRNIAMVRNHIGSGPEICMAVKADAYGHGAAAVARTALDAGVSRLGIATPGEGAELREAAIDSPLVMFGLPDPDSYDILIRNRISPFIADRRTIESLSSFAENRRAELPVHLKIDTGMGRIGCTPGEAPDLAERIVRSAGLSLEGVCTHFPAADSSDRRFTLKQIEVFREAAERIRGRGIEPGILHASNSAGVLDYPEANFDMVRPGIILYGYYPSPEMERFLPVYPVMDFVSRVSFLKRVADGTPISYGLTYRVQGESFIATVPAGYGDGYSRLLSNRGQVVIRGRRYPIAGRICMDQFMVDLGPETDVEPGDEVTLFGHGSESPTAEEIAAVCGTIPYETTCAVSKRVPRQHVTGPDTE